MSWDLITKDEKKFNISLNGVKKVDCLIQQMKCNISLSKLYFNEMHYRKYMYKRVIYQEK